MESAEDTCAVTLRRQLRALHTTALDRLCFQGMKWIHTVLYKPEPDEIAAVSLEHPGTDGNARTEFFEAESWSESYAKNRGLEAVKTPLVAFTNADTILDKPTLDMTLRLIEHSGFEDFILQGMRWEIPRQATNRLIEGKMSVLQDFSQLASLSVPHAFPKQAIGEWQVTRTQTAWSIGGFDERMVGANAYGGMDTDFHERCRAWNSVVHKIPNGGEIVSRDIPVLHPFHYAERPFSPNNAIRHANLERFIELGTPEALDWRNL